MTDKKTTKKPVNHPVKAKKEGMGADKLVAFYKKYPHVVKDSVRENSKAVHGISCTVRCTKKGCSATREVNLQDAFQSLLCEEHRREAALARKHEKQAKKEAKRAAKKEAKRAAKKAVKAPEVTQEVVKSGNDQLRQDLAAALNTATQP